MPVGFQVVVGHGFLVHNISNILQLGGLHLLDAVGIGQHGCLTTTHAFTCILSWNKQK